MIFSGERISPTAAIASILNSYPFSVGLFRELLQNSDDAKASKQIFVLDCRHHPVNTLYHPHLAAAQGPALLAYNDGIFSDQDWEAVQTIYESSKTADTSKIGKYGIGFRSSYHVTDNPQILSGSTLAMFDPHRGFTNSGGATVDFTNSSNAYEDQLSSFDLDLFRDSVQIEPFNGTIIRLPLRTSAGPAGPARTSLIKNAVVEPVEVHQLLHDFIEGELAIVLLFLTNISSIEIHEIDDEGKRCLARAELFKEPLDQPGTYRCIVSVTTDEISGPVDRSWRIFHASFPESESVCLLSDRIQQDASEILKKQKLSPRVALAMPLTFPNGQTNSGRLFTYLPLPLQTGFPCHIHGLFALTPDRQHLRNSEETGLVPGSTDAVLVEWNRLLFDVFVPRTWAALLPVLLTTDHHERTNVFKLWPPYQPVVQGGDTIYWHSLPRHLLRKIVEAGLPIWPIVGQKERSAKLESVLVASGAERADLLLALAKAGVSITNPPHYVRDLLVDVGAEYQPLNPSTSREAMLANIPSVLALDPSDRDCILIYLLSHMDLSNIIGLPIIRLISGRYISLLSVNSIGAHTLLRRGDYDVFRDCDDSAIALHRLPSAVANLLFEKGPSTLNVAHLSCQRVVDYIRSMNLDTTAVSAQTIPWLVKLWMWFGGCEARKLLYAAILDFSLIPTSRNTLISPRHGIFSSLDDDILIHVLQTLGISFLHPSFNDDACRALDEQGVIQSPHTVHDVLDTLADVPYCLDSNVTDALRKHIASCLPISCHEKGPLNDGQRLKLLALPIYPILVPPMVSTGNNDSTLELGAIPADKKVICVTSMRLLPVLDDTIFVHDCGSLLKYAGDDLGDLMRVDGVLLLAINHLIEQPKHLQRAFVEYIVAHQYDITRGLLDKLSRTPFVAVANGTSHSAPLDVVDPDTDLAELLKDYLADIRLPCVSLADDMAIVNGLKHLNFLRSGLYDALVRELIIFISTTQGSELAQRLLHLIIKSDYDCSSLDLDSELRWLPTKVGIRGPQHCHHHDAHRPELFDRVLPALEVPRLSSSLQAALRWDKSLPLDVVTKQFAQVLTERRSVRVVPIIKELGRRVDELTEEDFAVLRSISDGQEWIPNSSGDLVTTSHAVFSSLPPLPDGYYGIPKNLTNVAKLFLERMGCAERPSPNTLMNDLSALSRGRCSLQTTKKAVALLESLVATKSCDGCSSILVPDVNNRLHPRDKMYFNDLGHRASLIPLPDDRFMTHPKIDRELAQSLEIPLLGLSGLKPFDDDDEDMGELLTTRISNVLLQYTVEQAFGELVSNAADAGAKNFDILVDEQTYGSSNILSPTLAQFQLLPALMVHNDAVFTESDFKGIRRIGKGGKDGRSDSIGQFGLGALSLYHFTEIVVILSGDKIMFLDPSKEHLGFPGKASVLFPISHIKRCFNDHLAPFNGLFEFSPDTDYYPGTLFRLSLRSINQACKSSLSTNPLSAGDVERLILTNYWDTARDALLFTELDTLSASQRTAAGSHRPWWSVGGSRSFPIAEGDHLTSHGLQITGYDPMHNPIQVDWQIVSQRTGHGDLPEEFQPLIKKHRLRDPVVTGYAADLTRRQTKQKNRLFSGLPLPILTSLAVQFNASFILAEDRRSVRFDGDGQVNLESQYNRWVLSELGPPLYIFLLELLLQGHQKSNKWWHWWPGAHQTGRDPMTNALVQSFYSRHLLATSRYICLNMAGIRLRPQEARLVGGDDSVIKLLRRLEPREVIELPDRIRHLLDGQIQSVQPGFVRQVIMDNSDLMVRGFNDWLDLNDLKGITQFLLEDGLSSVMGLPLLPLANKQLTTWEEYTGSTKMHYVWEPSGSDPYRSLFPLDHFVDSRFSVQAVLGLKNARVNVSKLTGVVVRKLVQASIPEVPQRDSVTPQERRWISLLWSALGTMDAKAQDLKNFPLVATSEPKTYISPVRCLSPRVFLSEVGEPWLIATLTKLGATVAPTCPRPVREFFDVQKKVLGMSFTTALPFLAELGASTLHTFSRSHGEEYAQLAEWSRAHIGSTPKGSVAHARMLPIWPTLSRDGNTSYVAAANALVLPSRVLPGVVSPFLSADSNIVEYSNALASRLRAPPMNFSAVRDSLNLPRTLSQTSTRSYLRLLELMIANRSHDSRAVQVPNTLGTMVSSNALYSFSEALFREAFHTRPENLIHEDFRRLESGLSDFGLQTQMCFTSFKACVTAIHEDIYGENRVRRASSLFEWYNQVLPIHSAGNRTSWRELDSLRFIPRDEVRQRAIPSEMAPYARDFPELVAPEEILRLDFEAIAWTQRALFLLPPSARLLIADLHLGIPSVFQVVNHLRVLAKCVAHDFPSNLHVLSDITKTYEWLESQADSPELKCIEQYKEECLFLNVDYPKNTAWTWHCAERMFFGIPDSDNIYARVGKFLLPFEGLLRCAGVKEIKNPARPQLNISSPEAQLALIRSSLNDMRGEVMLTDVTFESDDGKMFPAHRAFLATQTEYFRDQFSRNWTTGSGMGDHFITMKGYSGSALGATLDYIYTGVFPTALTDNEGELVDVLNLSHYWNLPDLHETVQNLLTQHVSLDSFNDLRETAKSIGAKTLKEFCDRFESENSRIISELQNE